MALLEKWNPLRDMERLRHEFDDLLEGFGFEHGGLFKGVVIDFAETGD